MPEEEMESNNDKACTFAVKYERAKDVRWALEDEWGAITITGHQLALHGQQSKNSTLCAMGGVQSMIY